MRKLDNPAYPELIQILAKHAVQAILEEHEQLSEVPSKTLTYTTNDVI